MKFRKKIAGAFVALGMTAALLSAGVAYAEGSSGELYGEGDMQQEENMEALANEPSPKVVLYRLYNPYVPGGDHHYTIDKAEHDRLVRAGWVSESTNENVYRVYSEYASGTTPVYREYNPYAATGTHNWTTDRDEHKNLISAGWLDEGVAWYSTSVETEDFTTPVYRLYNEYTGEHFYCRSLSEYRDVIAAGWYGESEKSAPSTTNASTAMGDKPCWYGLGFVQPIIGDWAWAGHLQTTNSSDVTDLSKYEIDYETCSRLATFRFIELGAGASGGMQTINSNGKVDSTSYWKVNFGDPTGKYWYYRYSSVKMDSSHEIGPLYYLPADENGQERIFIVQTTKAGSGYSYNCMYAVRK